MGNTYQFLGPFIPLLNTMEDKAKFEAYKNQLADNDYDSFIEIDENKYINNNIFDDKKLFNDMQDDNLVVKCPKYCKNGIVFDYYFYKWGFIEYTKKLKEDNTVIRIFTYFKTH